MPMDTGGGWIAWYRFAYETLGYSHREAASYANLRYVEEQNRLILAGRVSRRIA